MCGPSSRSSQPSARSPLANARGQADAAQDELYKRLNDKDRALRAAQAKAAGNAAALAKARKDRDEIARQREEPVAALARRDQTLAAEVGAYREEITKIASSPDPQKQKALQRFAAENKQRRWSTST